MFPRKQIKANAKASLSANYWPVVGYPLLLGFLTLIVVSITSSGSLKNAMMIMNNPDSMYAAEDAAFAIMGKVLFGDLITILISTFVINIVMAGEMYFYFKFYSGSKGDFSTFFEGFRNGQYPHVLGGMFLMTLYITLWTLLFVLPGAILLGVGVGMLFFSDAAVAVIIIALILYFTGFVFAIMKAYQYSMIPYLLLDKPEFTVRECFDMTKKMTKGNKWNLFVLDLSFLGWWILSIFTLFILAIFYVDPYNSLARAGAYHYLKSIHMPEDSAASEDETSEDTIATNTAAKVINNDDIFEE